MKLYMPTSRIALNMGDIPITMSYPGEEVYWRLLEWSRKNLQPRTSGNREEVVCSRGSENDNIIVAFPYRGSENCNILK